MAILIFRPPIHIKFIENWICMANLHVFLNPTFIVNCLIWAFYSCLIEQHCWISKHCHFLTCHELVQLRIYIISPQKYHWDLSLRSNDMIKWIYGSDLLDGYLHSRFALIKDKLKFSSYKYFPFIQIWTQNCYIFKLNLRVKSLNFAKYYKKS